MTTAKARGALLRGTAIAAVFYFSVAAGAAWAQATSFTFDIPAEPLDTALHDFARVSGEQIIFTERLVAGKSVAPLHGKFTPDEALAHLLAGSGLVVDRSSPNGIMIQPKKEQAALNEGAASSADVETVTVTGTRIRGDHEVAAPTTTLTRDDIAKSGYTSIQDVLRDLPQNFSDINSDSFGAGGGGHISNAANGNLDNATGIDLYGLGAESTLTLFNGTRLAASADGRVVDVSAIPLSVIDRIEVVTGGRSAIYGSDAVGGVVNIVTRQDFDGAQTEVLAGDAGYGGGRVEVNQTVGTTGDDAGIVASYDYLREWPTDLTDAGLIENPTPKGSTQLAFQTIGNINRHTGYLSGHWEPSNNVRLFGTGFITSNGWDDLQAERYPGATTNTTTFYKANGLQWSASGGAQVSFGDWQATLTGTGSEVDDRFHITQNNDYGYFAYQYYGHSSRDTTSTDWSANAEGPLFSIGNVTPRLAVGVEELSQSISTHDNTFLNIGGVIDVSQPPYKRSRDVTSVFGELFLPLIEDGTQPLLQRVEFTAAARADFYSDVGSTTNPQLGVVWQLSDSLMAKGSYGTSFRAPSLIELASTQDAGLFLEPDPTTGGQTPVLFWEGSNPNLKPETAKTWTGTVDYTPSWLPSTKFSVSYFNANYDNRIDAPSQSTDRDIILQKAIDYGSLINRSPTAAQVAAIQAATASFGGIENNTGVPFVPNPALPDLGLLAAFPNLVIYDARTNNIARETLQNLMFTVQSTADTDFGQLNFALNANYSPEHNVSIVAGAPSFSHQNSPGYPADFRFRSSVDWSRGPYGAQFAVNYVNGYPNPFSTPAQISSFTTVDLALRLIGASLDNPALHGFNVSLAIENVFDKRPPTFVDRYSGISYDPTNANSIGRYFSLRVVEKW